MKSKAATDQEWTAIQDRACRFYLCVDRAEFLQGWRDGRYDWNNAASVAALFPLGSLFMDVQS